MTTATYVETVERVIFFALKVNASAIFCHRIAHKHHNTTPAGCSPSTRPPYCLVKSFGHAARPCRVDEYSGAEPADVNTEWSSSTEHPREHHAPRLRNTHIRDQTPGNAAFKVEVSGLPSDIAEKDAKELFAMAGKTDFVGPPIF